MTNDVHNQELSTEELAELEAGLRKEELQERLTDANIRIKQESGYFEAVSFNAAIDRWRKTNADDYSKQRRKDREREAAEQGRTLRSYEPATPERRREQLRLSKAKARLDPSYAADEQAKNTAAKKAARGAMTDEEREEANRIRRDKRAAQKATPSAD